MCTAGTRRCWRRSDVCLLAEIHRLAEDGADAPDGRAAALQLLWYAFTHLRVLRIAPVNAVFHRQIFFTGR